MVLLPLLILWLRQPLSFSSSLRWMLLSVFLSGMLSTGSPAWAADPMDDRPGQTHRREGTLLDSAVGEIMVVGDRWGFVMADGTSYRLLENLTLQRIVRKLKNEPEDKMWSVDAELTEFMDENFARLLRAVRAETKK